MLSFVKILEIYENMEALKKDLLLTFKSLFDNWKIYFKTSGQSTGIKHCVIIYLQRKDGLVNINIVK